MNTKEKNGMVLWIIMLIVVFGILLVAAIDSDSEYFKYYSHAKLGDPMVVSTEKPCYLKETEGSSTYQLWTIGPMVDTDNVTYIGEWKTSSNGTCVYSVFMATGYKDFGDGCFVPAGKWIGSYDCAAGPNKYFEKEKKKAGIKDVKN